VKQKRRKGRRRKSGGRKNIYKGVTNVTVFP
jgi:hypothetical protein